MMTTNATPMQHPAASEPHVDLSRRQMRNAQAAARYDPYLVIHKGLRALMTDTLQRVGRMDPDDDEDTAQALAQLREFVTLAKTHLHHEDLHVHPAMEARAPGSTRSVEADHLSHREAMAGILDGCDAVERSTGDARAAAALALYRRLALFVADDLVHMHAEETENNAVLWATYSDDELHAMVERLVASIPPATNAIFARWMVASSSPAERATLLRGVRQTMPAEAFGAMLGGLAQRLAPRDRVKLEAALA